MNKRFNIRLLLIALFLMAIHLYLFAQEPNEPPTNIGKYFSEVKAQFPNLRFLEHTPNGDNY